MERHPFECPDCHAGFVWIGRTPAGTALECATPGCGWWTLFPDARLAEELVR